MRARFRPTPRVRSYAWHCPSTASLKSGLACAMVPSIVTPGTVPAQFRDSERHVCLVELPSPPAGQCLVVPSFTFELLE
ncbi:hypothetical protein J6590_028515 [Homalodisca vitripennis]|nr:hypothetical protein J6590_028515 [Homalodisca vitripennis]